MYKKLFQQIVLVLLVLSMSACAAQDVAIVIADGSTIGAGQVAYGLYQVYQEACGTAILQDPSGTTFLLTWAQGPDYYYAVYSAITGKIAAFSASPEQLSNVYKGFLNAGYTRSFLDDPNLPAALTTLLSAWGTAAKELIAIGMSMPVNTMILVSPAMLQPPAPPTAVVIDT